MYQMIALHLNGWWIVYRINDFGCPVDVGMSRVRWLAERRHRRAGYAYSAMKDHVEEALDA